MLAALILTTTSILPIQVDGQTDSFSRGTVEWFDGNFASALKASEKEGQLLMVEFWADWCGWCKAHEGTNLKDPKVLAAYAEFTCMGADLSVDEDGNIMEDEAADLMRLFSVQSFPTLIFIRPDGTAEDVISGFLPAQALTREINRIKHGKNTVSYFERMIARHPKDLEWRFKLGMKLSMLGDNAGYQREIDSIRKLDPEGTSLPMRRLALGQLREILGGCLRDPNLTPDPTDLAAFIKRESEDELLSDAWLMMGAVHNELGAPKKTIEAYRNAWKHATPLQRPDVGNGVAYAFWTMRDDLSLENKRLALRISLRATNLFQEINFSDSAEAQFLDTLACCYFMNAKYQLSLETMERCLELDAGNQTYEDRIKEFSQR